MYSLSRRCDDHPAMQEPTREEVDALTGPTMLEFGASWCGYCKAAQPDITAVVARHPEAAHLKIEDGKGKPLGRSFRVKLWPTLVLMDQGREVGRVVRPNSESEIEALFRGVRP
jgi:thioredoxin 1